MYSCKRLLTKWVTNLGNNDIKSTELYIYLNVTKIFKNFKIDQYWVFETEKLSHKLKQLWIYRGFQLICAGILVLMYECLSQYSQVIFAPVKRLSLLLLPLCFQMWQTLQAEIKIMDLFVCWGIIVVKNDKFINGKEKANSSIKHNWAKSNEVKEYFKVVFTVTVCRWAKFQCTE